MAKSTIQQTRNQGYEPRKLGAEVRRLRDEKGLSQDELAKNASVSKQGLSKLERGQVVPSIPILERIAGVLGVDLADLIRTGYDRGAIATSTTAAELNHLVGQLTEAQRELAPDLLKAVARQKKL
ncbi:MAG: XRE family transcriptional regulator [Rhodospirillaceae bacterium]|nr:MAG: XRE family transcriptional regulator [Rhodospirillaceae bacterium]